MRFLELPWLDFSIAITLIGVALGQPDPRALSRGTDRPGLYRDRFCFRIPRLAGLLRRRRCRFHQPA